MKVYLLRHGQTEYNVDKRYQGTRDIPLSEKGRAALRRAAGVADVLPGEPVYARVEEYRDSAVAYALRVWTTPAHYYDVRADLLDAVWREFKAAGVEMTYPHLVVHTPHEAIKQ